MNPVVRSVLLAALCVSSAGHTADLVPAATKKLDAYFNSLEQAGLVNGSVAISERGVVRYKRSLGFATIQNGEAQPADEGTRYPIAGVTRLFTAVLTLQLAEQARITLDNKLAEFYPDEPDAIAISYRDMLANRGGPGLESNYRLLGRVVEKVANRPYGDVLIRNVSNRLGLVRTYFAGTGNASSLESRSYRWTPGGWEAAAITDPALAGAAGGMLSNAADLVTFMDALFAGKIVTPNSLETLREQRVVLESIKMAGLEAVGARGSIDAFDAAVFRFPARNLSIAWTANASRISADAILDEAMRLVVEKRRKPPEIRPGG